MSTKLGRKRVFDHFASVKAGSLGGKETQMDLQKTFEEDFKSFSTEILNARQGKLEDARSGVKMSPVDISLSKALALVYGCTFEQYMSIQGLHMNSDSLSKVAEKFGRSNINTLGVEDAMIAAFDFESSFSTEDISSEWKFIIPEIIASAIRLGYEHSSLHNNWIGSTTNMINRELTMPRILRGDGMPTKVNEGADMPFGSLDFGQKKVDIFKIGTGFRLTDELINDSTLDLFFQFLSEVGNDMSIGADALAIDVMLNGEQSDASEAITVIGVETTSSIKTIDLRRIMSRMSRLKVPVNRGILNEEDTLIDLNAAMTSREETTIAKYTSLSIDDWIVPGNQGVFLNSARTMTKLFHKGLVTERRRNPRNQTNELFISDHINFAIINKNARIAYDKDIAFSGNGFPADMDIDARINTAFKEF